MDASRKATGAFGRRSNELGILGEYAIGVSRCRRFYVRATLLQLIGRDFDMDGPFVDVNFDDISIAHKCNGASESSFWRDMTNTQSLGSAAETAVGDYSDLTTET
jgi:hypothetical protein